MCPWLNFLLESLILFDHKMLFIHAFIIHSHNRYVFSIRFVPSTVLSIEDVTVSKIDMFAAFLNFQFSEDKQTDKQ